ncbi:PREDICTED: protein windpipe [Cyphomyrmex costatus]|uniref:Leucine-rich repeat-containing protein 26 n=1 Tax=Cyphomyrmex costatus TaxID=456900 RepID=A0A195C8S9_9HYME|nr:PREDICTED: protein windpipe [Cyphomyrmex costatus]KYM97269.1 Leucine-rich repeat-containing protein 26 [Cyphomyrmex costatus]
MQAAPPLLSFLLILLYHSGWTHGLCKLENSTMAWCDQLKDLKDLETHDLETLSASVAQDILMPGLFDNLTSLRHLDLSDGDLRKIEPGSFRALNNLKSLNLGDNRIEYLDLASLEGLTHLRSLNLRRNVIRQLPPALARLKNLKHLDIHGNPLECNCASLKVRDLIVQRGVTVSKKVVCAGPGNMKGTSLMKPSAIIICSFEEQDREMQNDQAEGSGESDLGSGDVLDELSEEEEEEDIENKNTTSEKPNESEVETPFPTVLVDSTSESSISKVAVEVTTGATTNSLQHSSEDEEIFFDNEDKKEQTSTTEMSQKKNIKDVLFYPTAGSGDGDEGSGEGSGATGTHYDEEETEKADTNEGFFATGAGLFNAFFGFGTATTSTTKEPNIEEEEFIHVSTTNLATEETIVSDKSYSVGAGIEKTTEATKKIVSPNINTNDVELASSDIVDNSKSGNIMDRGNNEQAVSSPKQSKKGMGSYVVLAVLLAIVVALIGFAAYRGDICKKRKSRDVETGTEMKEIQKSLLEHGENSTQPKKEANTPYVMELESDPLVKVKSAGDDAKIDEIRDDDYQTRETPRLNGTVDHSEPMKPPRKQLSQDENAITQDVEVKEERPRVDVNSLKKNFLEDRNPQPSTSATTNGPTTHFPEPNGPPLSPGAQRVKITLQEIPDSVPKTPILITRTMAGENLVKTP